MSRLTIFYRSAQIALIASLCLDAADPAHAQSVREDLLARSISPDLGGGTTRDEAGQDAFKLIAGNAAGMSQASFVFGNQMFTTVWTETPGPQPTTDGLGPVFNREACSDCHVDNGRGQPPPQRAWHR